MNFKLKTGKSVTLRQAEMSDYESVNLYLNKIATETIYTQYYPGRSVATPDQFQKDIQNNLYCLARDEEKIIGAVSAKVLEPNHPWKNKICRFGVHVLKAYQNQGLGNQLMVVLEEWAKNRQLHKIEAVVRDENRQALALYIKHGFIIEGFRHDTALIDGVWHGDYDIGKVLD
ncbi:MAG: GNAT family N-acetyltransferase [Alphaproteobacteria bacterium]|nr:GNAT family N-acetyltransferase [Alphaproteobacteria bacterium]